MNASKLYVAGIQYGWRRLGKVCGATRKKFLVSKSNSPMSAFRGRTNDASAS